MRLDARDNHQPNLSRKTLADSERAGAKACALLSLMILWTCHKENPIEGEKYIKYFFSNYFGFCALMD